MYAEDRLPGRRRHEDSWMISDLEKLNHMRTIINLFYDTHAFKCVFFFLFKVLNKPYAAFRG